jgi:hypothetical protein
MSQSDRETSIDRAGTPGTLFVSFWELCLDNFSFGKFVHYCVQPQEAASLIERARAENRLRGVCEPDLLAPYEERERKRHEQLCEVLRSHWGIDLTLDDFLTQGEDEGETFYSVYPLEFARVEGNARLMVVTCAYTLPESLGQSWQIDRDSVAFHLIEVAS